MGTQFEKRLTRLGRVQTWQISISNKLELRYDLNDIKEQAIPTSEAAFFKAWLTSSNSISSIFDSIGTNKIGNELTEDLADEYALSIIGKDVATLVQKVCKASSIRPYQYGQAQDWYLREYNTLKDALKKAVARTSLATLEQASVLRNSTRLSLDEFITNLNNKKKSVGFIHDLAMYISLRQAGPLLDVSGLKDRINDKKLSDNQIWDKQKWTAEINREACAPSSPYLPKTNWYHRSWANSSIKSIYSDASESIYTHLGVSNSPSARTLLIAKTPVLALLTQHYSVDELISILFKTDKDRLLTLKRKLKSISQSLNDALIIFNKDIKKLTSDFNSNKKKSDWSRYAPLVKFMTGLHKEHKPPDSLLTDVVASLIPKEASTLSEDVALGFTVIGITLAFIPPLALASAAFSVASSMVTIGSKIAKYNKVVEENNTRKKLISSSSKLFDTLTFIENPSSTKEIEYAIIIEAIFGAFLVIDAVKAVETAKKVKKLKKIDGLKKDRYIAIKKLKSSDREAKKRFVKEADQLDELALQHKSITRSHIRKAEIEDETARQAYVLSQLKGDQSTTLVAKPLTQKQADDLTTLINNVNSVPTETKLSQAHKLAKKSKGAVVYQKGVSRKINGKAATQKARLDTLKKQQTLEVDSVSASKARKLKSQKKAIDQKLEGSASLTPKNKENLKQERERISKKLSQRKELELTRKLTGVSAKRLGKKIELAAEQLTQTRQLLAESNERVIMLQENVIALNKEIQATQDALSQVAYQSGLEAQSLKKAAEIVSKRADKYSDTANTLRTIAANEKLSPKQIAAKNKGLIKAQGELKEIQEKITIHKQRITTLSKKERLIILELSTSLKKLDATSGGKAVGTELIKRGVLNTYSHSEFMPEIERITGKKPL